MKQCLLCGNPIKTGFSKRSRFCSNECMDEYNKKYEKKKVCAYCGKPLTGKQRLYCSGSCSSKAWHREQREKEAEENAKFREETKVVKSHSEKLSKAEINELARAEGLSYGRHVAKYGL